VLNLWDYYGDSGPTEDPNFLEALGFGGMTDEVAIVTKAKENIVFAMATLSMRERSDLSYTKHEFVQKCSFNSQGCNIEEDFITHVDPIFGNCFTFNHNRSVNRMSIRAGPMYGLRLVVYVNGSEYLPTTEATGIKMTIHEKVEYPFPDTFGYNAPVGYISSFGIKLKRMERLSAPYGDCVKDGRTSTFIYTDYDYTTEGCFRSCFQQMVVNDCAGRGLATLKFPPEYFKTVNFAPWLLVASHHSRQMWRSTFPGDRAEQTLPGGRPDCATLSRRADKKSWWRVQLVQVSLSAAMQE
jgi:hypothetical protein